ncbi:MAG: hypothetical protein AVDCRST_MAG56-793, partial [uncultured Cytophagales bacterium]
CNARDRETARNILGTFPNPGNIPNEIYCPKRFLMVLL